MTKDSTKQATERQMIVRFAEFMGWHRTKDPWKDVNNWVCDDGSFGAYAEPMGGRREWNPTKNENHFRQLLERVMEDEGLLNRFIRKIIFSDCLSEEPDIFDGLDVEDLMKATLTERCHALYSVLNSQKE